MKPVTVGVTARAGNNLKLVEVAGPLEIEEGRAEDRELGVVAPKGAIYLNRKVEMYQWIEEVKWDNEKIIRKVKKKWSSQVHTTEDYNNPKEMPYRSKKFVPKKVMLGQYQLQDDLIKIIAEDQGHVVINNE